MSCAVFYWEKHFFEGITQLSVFFAYVILTKWYGAPLGYATFHFRLETTGRCDPLVTQWSQRHLGTVADSSQAHMQ